MQRTVPSCIKCVDEAVKCRLCGAHSVRNGKTSYGKQRYRCKICKRNFVKEYSYPAYKEQINVWISGLTKEGCGIRSIARLLCISPTTVLSRIIAIAKTICKPVLSMCKEYEVDELCSFVKRKMNKIWLVVVWQRDIKAVTDFIVGRRTLGTLQKITERLVQSMENKYR